MSKKEFTRRYYRRFRDVKKDIGYIMQRRARIRPTMQKLITPDFRERLMMTVTEVNGCRYCRDFHLKESLKSGVSEAELAELLEGRIPADTPPDEYTGLAYAQHWAENNALPDPDTTQNLIAVYGQEKADAIHLILRMIRIGNLSGNLFDYLLFKLSFGKFGLDKKKAPSFLLK